jgi:hypothetical protein
MAGRNWLDLDGKRQYLDSKQIRLAIGNPSPKAYARWRRICGVSKNPHAKLTEQQAFSLVACRILFCCRGMRGRNPEAIQRAVIGTVNDLLKSPSASAVTDPERFLAWCEGARRGRALLSIKPSLRPSRATLYRRGVRVASLYSAEKARRLLKCRTQQSSSPPKSRAERPRR